MSTYEEICKQRCEWCEAGNETDEVYGRPDLPVHMFGDREVHCTAPTPEQVIEEQAAEITRLKGLIAGLEHEPRCDFEQRYTHIDPCPFWTKQYCLNELEGQSVGCHPGECNCFKSKAVKS